MALVERRLNALEGTEPTDAAYDSSALGPKLGPGLVSSASTHIGRVLLIFGGAYLLRAITDFQFVRTGLGISLGAAYALVWLYMAWRQARTTARRADAAFFGATSVLLALPLLVEAVTRFELLSGSQGVLALALFGALALAVAAIRRLRSLAWLATAGGIATAIAVLMASHAVVAVAMFLLLLGVGSLAVAYRRQWMGLHWLGAIGADAGVLALIVFSGSDQWTVESRVPLLFGATLLLAYLAFFGVRSHLRGREVGVFEPVQALAAASVTLWAASAAMHAEQLSQYPIGAVTFAIGACGYALALTPKIRLQRGPNFYYYSSLGLLFVLAGSAIVLPLAAAAALWSLMALTLAWFSGRTGWVTLSLQSTLLLLAAGIGSGILAAGWQALAGDIAAEWPAIRAGHAGIALLTVACLFTPVAQHSTRWGVMAGLPQLIVLALSVWEVGGLIVLYAAVPIAGAGGAEPHLAVLAALRTAVLSAASVTLALSSGHKRWPEARWLVYPVLILVGIKLFVEDFPNGQPVTLFVALAFVGGALLLVAKLFRRGETAS